MRNKRTSEEIEQANMHRSASAVRGSEEFYMAAQAMGCSYHAGGLRSRSDMEQLLPTFDPQSDAAKKEASRAKVAENLVHVIPFILLLCAIILWSFSHPPTDINVMGKGGVAIGKLRSTPAGTDHGDSWNGGSSVTIMEKDRFDGGGEEGKGYEDRNGGFSNAS